MKRRDPGLWQAWKLVDGVGILALLVGCWAGALGWRPAAWILVATLCTLVGAHVAISVVAYRRTMRCEWPRVAALPFDDD